MYQDLVIAQREAVSRLELVVEEGQEPGCGLDECPPGPHLGIGQPEYGGVAHPAMIPLPGIFLRPQAFLILLQKQPLSPQDSRKEPPMASTRVQSRVRNVPDAGSYALDPTHSYVAFTA